MITFFLIRSDLEGTSVGRTFSILLFTDCVKGRFPISLGQVPA